MGGYTNECGKFFSNPTSDNPFSSSPSCSEKEILEYKKKSIERSNKYKSEKQESQRQLNETIRKEIQDEQAKVRKKYIIYGLIAVVGYFAYKKFKK
tara:strand:- start:375 stop:662 length:288 start_codon:yes stop_codon:yes gene_type:complete